jgi:hypothetical protein
MTGLFLIAWVVTPVLALVVSLGCGLLVRRAADGALPDIFVLPVGFALTIAIGALLTSMNATAELVGPVCALLAVVGLVLERRVLRLPKLGPDWVWPVLAAGAAFAVVAAPVVLSGVASFTGYSRIVDIAHQFDFSAYLATQGRDLPAVTDSSYLEMATKTLAIGYPGGWQGTLGGFARLTGTDLAWIYQPLLSVTAAMLALSLYGLLGRAIESRPLRAVAAGAAAQPNVLYAYGVVGGFKELAAASCLVLTLGVLAHAASERSLRSAVPSAVAISASLGSLNLTIVPWLGIFVAGTVLVVVWQAPRRMLTAPRLVALGAMVLVLSLPTVIEAVKLAPVAAQAEGSGRTVLVDLGNLAEPMPVVAAAGVWLTRDYRFTDTGKGPVTYTLIALVLALALLGVIAAVRRREWPIVLLGGSAGIALTYFAVRTGPWIQLKAIAISGPMVLACAFAGAASLWRGVASITKRPMLGAAAGWLVAGTVALGVLAGNALAYHDATVAPAKRLRDLEHVGDRLAGKGPTLYPANEEYAEYFLRDAKGVGLVNPPRGGVGFPQVRPDAVARQDGKPNYAWDLDELQTAWVEKFPYIVNRRGPGWSRPPSNFDLAFETPYHWVWHRARPASTVIRHVPAPLPRQRASTCARFGRAAARSRGARLAYAQLPPSLPLVLKRFTHSGGWGVAPQGQLLTAGQGEVDGRFRLPQGGRYRVWLGGDFGRAVEVTVDGRLVGTLKDRHNYPEQSELVALRDLKNGRHTFEIRRGGGDLEPGNSSGDEFPIGPLVFELVTPNERRVQTTPAADAKAVCAKTPRLDWVELVRPG